jgi:hypothetical protein
MIKLCLAGVTALLLATETAQAQVSGNDVPIPRPFPGSCSTTGRSRPGARVVTTLFGTDGGAFGEALRLFGVERTAVPRLDEVVPEIEVAVAAEFGELHSKLGDYRLHTEDGQLSLTACLARGVYDGVDGGAHPTCLRLVTMRSPCAGDG